MTACSLLRLLILTQPSKLIFSISGQLLRFSRQRIFLAPKYIHSFYFHKPKKGKQKISVGDCIEYFLLYHRWGHLER